MENKRYVLREVVKRKLKDKFIQLCLDYKNVPKTKEVKFPCWMSQKYDGVFCIAHKQSKNEVVIYSRTGEVYTSMKHLENQMVKWMGINTLLVFEAYIPGESQGVISGYARDTKNQHPELVAYVHDWLTLDEFLIPGSGAVFAMRYARVCQLQDFYPKDTEGFHLVEQRFCPDIDAALHALEIVVNDGGEGIILSDPEAQYWGGERNLTKVKLKATVTYDLKVVGIVEGRGKYQGMAGALLVEWFDAKTLKVSGMTDVQRKEWFENPKAIVGSIVEVEAMRDSANGKLREPRFKSIRTDKQVTDVEENNKGGRINVYSK